MAYSKFVGTPKKATTHVNQNEDLIFEKSSPGKKAYRLAELDVPAVLGWRGLRRRILISRRRFRRAAWRL